MKLWPGQQGHTKKNCWSINRVYISFFQGKDHVLIHMQMHRVQKLWGKPGEEDADAPGGRSRSEGSAADGSKDQAVLADLRPAHEDHSGHFQRKREVRTAAGKLRKRLENFTRMRNKQRKWFWALFIWKCYTKTFFFLHLRLLLTHKYISSRHISGLLMLFSCFKQKIIQIRLMSSFLGVLVQKVMAAKKM